MADLNANINVGIETTQALDQLKALQRQISQFHQSVSKSSAQASLAQRDLQKNFLNGVNAIQGFSAELKTVRTTAESFTNSLEKNKFSMREYFRYSAGATKTFGRNFAAEMSTIERTAIERVKTLQTQYVKMGRDAQGAMKAIAIRPTVLNMQDLGTQTAIAAQKQVLFNQLIKQGSTNLLNFGKNTQWAGRQLMVGFTLPLATLGMTAGRVFMDMEKAAIKFKKVYGDLFTAPGETEAAMESIIELGKAYTAYGVAVSDALSMAADAAAAGFAGADLQNQTAAALKLSVLGQLDLNKALETTISLQNAFGISSKDLATEIDFLNAVENQTVISLDDMTTAIPKAGPVVQSLGGDVRDLAFFMAAMKEGGINASEGANALKSGLASLINPTQRARDMLSGFGVNLRGIIDANAGDVTGVVVDFAKALDTLDPLNRAQAIEQLFGKFQFARLSTLFANVAKDGTQASRVLELAGSSVEELAALSEGELGVSAASSMNKFLSAVENIKLALAPIGKIFLDIATPIIEFGTRMLEAFNNLPDGIKKAIGTVITIIGGIGPIALMTFGLINNGIANMIKFFATVRLGYLKITGQAKGVGDETNYMTQEQLEAAAAAASLDQAHAGLTQRFTAEKAAVDALRVAYQQAAAAGASFALNYPGMMKPVPATQAQAFAKGGVVSGPGTGTSDSIPALLSNGEAVIPARQAKKYAPIIQGMIAGNLPGFADGVFLGMPRSNKSVSKNREVADVIYQDFLNSKYANVPPTEYGHQISKTSGHSFPIFGLGGVYSKPGGENVFVKPVLDEAGALAEIRATQIARQAHGLEAPIQKIVVIRDPLDPTRERKFLALESALDSKFVQNEPKAIFNEDQYFRQLVASLLRVDKDLSASNVFGNVVADVGPAGVFDRASGKRALKTDLPSMEDQALINLLGIRGGAKRAFAESTLALMAGLTPQQYHQRMIAEIQKALPALRKTVAEFGLSNPTEVKAYDAMIKRLETGLTVDWSKFHSIHSNVKVTVPKPPKVAKAVNLANGGMVRGPGGPKDDAIPANLSNGEAVIDAATVKKNPAIIAALFQKKRIVVPGYAENNGNQVRLPSVTQLSRQFTQKGSSPANASHLEMFSPRNLIETLKSLGGAFAETEVFLTRFVPVLDKFGVQVERNGEKVYRASEGLVKIKDLKPEEDALVRGNAFGGTTILESQVRNAEAYEKAGIGGASFTLQDVVIAGDKAAAALSSSADISDEVRVELELLVEEARIAREKLAKESSASDELAYSKEVATKALYEAIQKDTSNSMTDQQAREHVRRQVIEAEQAHAARVSAGMNEQESLRLAQKELAAKMFLASKRMDQDNVHVVSGPQGTSTKLIRPTAAFSPTMARGVDIENIENITKTVGGRPAADVAARIIKAEEAEALAAKEGFNFGDAVRKLFFSHVRKGLGIESPSTEFSDISNNVAEGVRQAEPKVKEAATDLAESITKPIADEARKNLAKGSAFGNINTKEPVPEVRNASRAAAPTQVVQAMSQEATATKTFIGDIKTSFASMRANLARELGWVKEEFKLLSSGVKNSSQAATQASIGAAQRNLEINKAANNQIIVENQKAGFNYVAAMQGRNGAVEAILTKGNAAIISAVTEQFNIGARLTPKLVSDGIKSGLPQVGFMGEEISKTVVRSMQKAAAENWMTPAPGMSQNQYGPAQSPDSKRVQSATNLQLQNLGKFSSSMSTVTMGMSALTGVLSMFGGEMSAVISGVSMVTGVMFILMQATTALAASQSAATLMNNVNAAGGFGAFFNSFKGVSKGLKGLGKGIGGVFGAVSKAFPIASRLVPILGLLVAGFAAYSAILENIARQRQKVEGLGNAAAFTADQLKNLGDKLNIEVDTIDYGTGVGVDTGQSTQEQDRAAEFLQDPDFAVDYADPIAGLEGATTDQAQRVLDSLATQLINSGIDEDIVNAIILALIQYAKRTDLELTFNAIKIDSDQAAADVVDSIMPSIDAFNEVELYPDGYGQGLGEEAKKEAEVAAGAIKSSFDSLNVAFENGLISVDAYNAQVATLFDLIANSQAPGLLINALAKDLGISEFVDQLDTLEAKTFAVKMAVANIQMTADEEKALIDGSKAMDTSAEQRAAAADVINNYADALDNAAASQRAANETQLAEDRQEAITDSFLEQKQALENNDIAYAALRESGLGAAEAVAAVGNAAFMEAFALAQTEAERQAAIDQYKEFIGLVANSPFEQAKATTSGGSNPIQDAIKSLKEQRQEVLNISSAYSQLRNNGESAADALRFAEDPDLMSAMNAGLKVGSARFNEMIKLIKEAEAATKSWQNATVQGQTEMFEDVYSRVTDVFNANEALLDAAFESATKADNQLIQFLEKQIENITRQIDEYSRDLDGIAEAEEEINKTYDKKVEALEKVKKVNDDILRQQKSQISLADALSKGDISAAASIIEEKRAADAASALQAQGNRASLVRDAQLAGVTSKDGLTRVQVEERIKQLKKDIETIEFGALRDAQDRVNAAEEELEVKKDSLMVAGQTREQLELSKAAIDLAKASAQGYDGELQNALASVTGIVSQWKALGTTFTTTHKINTIVNPGSPSSTTSTARAASGGYISGPGTPTSDSIPAMLSDGEYVIKASSVDKFGTGFLDSVNAGQLPKFRLGGMVRDGGGSGRKAAPAYKPPVSIRVAERAASAPKTPVAEPLQNFEAGLQNVMTSIASNPVVQSVGNFINNSAPLKSLIAVASTPVEILGAAAKNNIEAEAKAYYQASQGDFLGAFGTKALAALTIWPKSIFEGTANAFAGVLDSNKARPSMFQQAGQAAIDNNLFGAKTDPEMAALARIIAGSLNIVGDPLTYLGIGAVSKGLKAAAISRNVPGSTPSNIIKSELDIDEISSATAYQIAQGKKPIVFEGIGQNFSSLLGRAEIVKPTPEGLIQQAIRSNPFNVINNLKLRSMLDNFKNNKIGIKEEELLDYINASVSIGRKSNDLSGLAVVIKSLTGDQASTALLNSQRSSLLKNTQNNRRAELERSSSFYTSGNDVADLNSLLAIHSTKFPIKFDKDGNVVMYPTGAYNKQVSRGSIHWTLNQLVRDHLQGNWNPLEQKILAPLSSLIDSSGLPYRADVLDTFFVKGPGEAFTIRDYNILTPIANSVEYMEELTKRGLLNSGNEIPDFAVDATKREILVRAPSKPVDQWAPEDMQEFLQNQNRAIEAAKNNLGVNRGPIDDNAVRNWARENNIGTGPHSQSIPERLEYSDDILGTIELSDSIEALRFAALGGRFKNPINSILEDVDMGPGLAKGGIVKPSYYAKGGIVKPSYYAKGGMVKPSYFAGGGMVKPSHFSEGGFAKGTDTVPAMLTPGEFVINKESSKTFAPLLSSINNEGRNFALPVYPTIERNYPEPLLNGGVYQNNQASDLSAQADNSVYNYSLSVNVSGTNANANDIANVVMNKIKTMESQQVRRQVLR